MLLKHQKSSWVPGAILAICLVALNGCEVGSATKGKSPFRAPTSTNSDVTSATSRVEVATSFNVNVTVKDKSGYGIPNVTPVVTMSKAVTGSSGVTSGGCSRTDQKGLTTCTLRASLPGTYTVSVTSPVAITAAATVLVEQYPRSLSFSVQPSASTVSAVVLDAQPKVLVLDKAGNPVPLPGTVTITMSGTSTTAVLSGTTSVAAGADGFADFEFSDATRLVANNLSVNLVGTYNFTASLTHATSGTITATSSAFAITAGVASKLGFTTQPASSSAANRAFDPQPVVAIQDAAGNTVTSDSSCVVTLSLSGGGASDSFLGTLSKTVSSGLASYSGHNLRVSTTVGGTAYQLSAAASGTCAGATSALSTPFTITLSGLPNQLSLVQAPGTSPINKEWSAQPMIKVLDVSGADVTTDNTTVVLLEKVTGTGTIVGSTSLRVTNGAANFVGLKTTGTVGVAGTETYTLRFRGINPGLSISSITVQQVINNNGETPNKLSFSTGPTSAAINQSIPSMVVEVQDTDGFYCFNDNSSAVTLTFTSGPAGATMRQNGTLVGAGTVGATTAATTVINGLATFSGISFNRAGAYTVTANSAGLTGITSNTFAITSFGAANRVKFFVQPADGVADGIKNAWATQPQVEIQDSQGNRVTSDNSTVVVLSCASPLTTPACTISGTVSRTVINGLADFAGANLQTSNTTALQNGVAIKAEASPNPNSLLSDISATFNEQ